MAIYHLSMKSLGRKSGQSAVAAAAYRATEKLVDIDGEVKDFTKKEKALWDAMLAPEGAPEWTKDRGEYWRNVERKENRSNSEFCKNIDLALPKELLRDGKPTTAMIGCATKWAWNNFVARGLVVDVTVHGPHKDKDGNTNNNWHAHVLVSTRAIGKDGWAKHKDALLTDKNRNIYLEELRKSWADTVNDVLAYNKIKSRIDHRTLEEQGIDRQPQQHMGPAATAIARKGGTPKRTRKGEHKPRMRLSLRHEYLAMDESKLDAEISACHREIVQLQAAILVRDAVLEPAPAVVQPVKPVQRPVPAQPAQVKPTQIKPVPAVVQPVKPVQRPVPAQPAQVKPTQIKPVPAVVQPVKPVQKPAPAQPVSLWEGLTGNEIKGLKAFSYDTAKCMALKYSRFGGQKQIHARLKRSPTSAGQDALKALEDAFTAAGKVGRDKVNWIRAVRLIELGDKDASKMLLELAKKILNEFYKHEKASQTHEAGLQRARMPLPDTEQGYS